MFIGVWIYDTFHPGELDTLCIWMRSSRPALIGMSVSLEPLRLFVTQYIPLSKSVPKLDCPLRSSDPSADQALSDASAVRPDATARCG